MNSIDKGKFGESHVAAHFVAQGYHVFLPVFSYPECDMILMKDGEIKRVEVKTTSSPTRHGGWSVSLRRIRNNGKHTVVHKFDGACADLLAVYILPENRVEVFDPSRLHGTTNLTISRKVAPEEANALEKRRRD